MGAVESDDNQPPPENPWDTIKQLRRNLDTAHQATERVVREKQVLTSKLETMKLALARVPTLLQYAAIVYRDTAPSVPVEIARKSIEAFAAQSAQFTAPYFSVEQEARLAAQLEEMGQFELAKSEIIAAYEAKLAEQQDHYEDEADERRKAIYEGERVHRAQVDVLRVDLEKSERRSQRRRERELDALKLITDYINVFRAIVNICRGFEGTLAEKVRRSCVRQIDAFEAHVERKKKAAGAAGNPGSHE